MTKKLFQIFFNGSKTYFYSSLFFPKEVRDDVFALYGFVRTADDFADTTPQNAKGFHAFVKQYRAAVTSQSLAHDDVIDACIRVMNKRGITQQDIDAFLHAMESDLTHSPARTMQDTIDYMYGSAEVIGKMMARILELPDDTLPAAQSLGRAMQYVNFIRDIGEDITLGRMYFPLSERKKFKLKTLHYTEVQKNPEKFRTFVRAQLQYYYQWNSIGEAAFPYIPRRYRIPIKTATDLYFWTAKTIEKDPCIVYRKKVKPSIPRITYTLIKNTLTA